MNRTTMTAEILCGRVVFRGPGNRAARGFTLAEIAIALVILSVLTVFVMDQLGPIFQYQSRVDTRGKIDDVAQALRNAYRAEIMRIESDPSARLTLLSGVVENMGPDAQRRCTASSAALAPLASYLQRSPGVAFRDGAGAPLCILITPQLSRVVGGVPLNFRVIAVVSSGWNNQLDADATCAGTTLSNSGELQVCGDDEAVRIDGLTILMDLVAETQARLDRVARTYERYFQARFEADPARDISVDYFASGTPVDRWDGGNPIATTGCVGAAPLMVTGTSSPHAVLGLSGNDVTDAFGQTIRFDNCSNAVRSPSNGVPEMQLPPYTAVFRAALPGGGALESTAVGSL